MKTRRSLKWLEKKMRTLNTFDGSLLKYVSSSLEMKEVAEKLEISSKKVLKLDSNENFFISPDYLNSIFKKILETVDLRLYDPEAIAEVREALGKYVGVPSECITMCSGSEQLIDFITRLFLERRNNAISIVPTFFMYKRRVELQGAKLITVPLNNDLSLNVESILEKVSPKTRLIFVCSPNNPTGNQFPWNKIESLADESSAVVVIDEAYAEFADYSVASSSVKKRNVIVTRTFSKAFGLAGMRFGYAVAHPDIALLLSEIIPYTVSTILAKYALELLNNVYIIEKSSKMVKVERKWLIDRLRSINGIKVFNSKANFVTFKPYRDADRIYRKLLEKGIMIKNLGDLQVIGHCLRVTVGLPHMNRQFLNVLKQILG